MSTVKSALAQIGYTAGPAIAHSWRVGHSISRSSARRVTKASAPTQEASSKVTPPPVAEFVTPVAKTPEIVDSKPAPPIQALE